MPPPAPRPPSRPSRVRRHATARASSPGERGAALLEALVALFVAGVALLLVVALLVYESRLRLRAAAQRQALAALEAVVEGVRVGAVPARSATWETAEEPWVPLPPGDCTLSLEVTPSLAAGVWEVRARLDYHAGPLPQARTLVTRVWRPGGS